MKICPICHREYDDSKSFCINDGALLVDKVIEDTSIGFCPNCGTPRSSGKNFCTKCGYDFANKKAATQSTTKKGETHNFVFNKKASNLIVSIFAIIVSIFALSNIFSSWLYYPLIDMSGFNGNIVDFGKIILLFSPHEYIWLFGFIGFISLIVIAILSIFTLIFSILSITSEEFSKKSRLFLTLLLASVIFVHKFIGLGESQAGFICFLSIIAFTYFAFERLYFSVISKNVHNSKATLYSIFEIAIIGLSVFIFMTTNSLSVHTYLLETNFYSHYIIQGLLGFIYLYSYTGEILHLILLIGYIIYMISFGTYLLLLLKKDLLKSAISGFVFSFVNILFIVLTSLSGVGSSYLANLIFALIFVLALSSFSLAISIKRAEI